MRILQVSEFIEIVNGVLKETLSADVIAVEGEISGYRVSQGQWVTFDLKDEKALVNVFMPLWNVNVPLEDGIRIRVFGLPRIYPKYGKFSLSAERLELAGEGALKKALLLLRKRLEQEGLFDPSRKRLLPRFPQRIALIASRESAAYGDFIRVVGERWGGLEIDLYHVLVQGEKAPLEIVKALSMLEAGTYDAVVMTRGGGSLEELMAFNDERVVRAIHASPIPTLVAIGHERDLTLAEEAADVRGSTPTDCARRLVPDRRDVLYELATSLGSIDAALEQMVANYHTLIERALLTPGLWLAGRRAQLEGVFMACQNGARQWLKMLHERLEQHERLLGSLDPKQVMRRGYAILRDMKGHVVTNAVRLREENEIMAVLHDGEVGLIVSRLNPGERQSKLL